MSDCLKFLIRFFQTPFLLRHFPRPSFQLSPSSIFMRLPQAMPRSAQTRRFADGGAEQMSVAMRGALQSAEMAASAQRCFIAAGANQQRGSVFPARNAMPYQHVCAASFS